MARMDVARFEGVRLALARRAEPAVESEATAAPFDGRNAVGIAGRP